MPDTGPEGSGPGGEESGNADADGAAPPALDLVSVGGAMVDRYYRLSNLPEPDGGAFVREAWRSPGGAAANVACAASRLGRRAGLVTRLGTDEGGDGHEGAERILADLRERGVDTARVRRGAETGTYSMVLAGPAGERMVVTGGESVRSLRLAEGDWPSLRAAQAVFTNAYAPDPVVAALVEARADGDLSRLGFDLSGPLPELEGRGTSPATIDRAAGTADLFVAGEVALRSYCAHHGVEYSPDRSPGSPPERAVALLRERGVRRAALTRGADGATLVTPDRTVAVPAFEVDVADGTGAGDAFTAGLLDAWILDGRPPADAGRFAAAVAALNCTAEGARGGLPTREAVRAFLDERER